MRQQDETIPNLRPSIFIFPRDATHVECGHRHEAGEFSHLVITKLADPFEQTVILSVICNGCNDYGGEWSYDYPRVPKKKK